MNALFQAALNFRDYRLPELFCGVQRQENDEPVHYPVSCSPQAWASGSWFLVLTSVLGIRPNAARRELNIINPTLPEWLGYLRIRNLRIGNSRLGLDFSRNRDRTFCNVVDIKGDQVKVNVTFK
jgi:glycogen debranching enzyme